MPVGRAGRDGRWAPVRRGLALVLGEGVAAVWAAAERLADVVVWVIRRSGLAPVANAGRADRRQRTSVSPPGEDG